VIVLAIDPFEAEIIGEIYQSYVNSKGLGAIAAILIGRGVPAPRGGEAWTKGTLWAILRNPLYKGTLVYGKACYSEIGKRQGKTRRPERDWIVVEDAAPAIIPVKLWEAAQAKHGTRKFGIGRPWHRPYLLSGLVVCDHCGKRFRAHKQTRGTISAYYVCGSYIASGAGICDGLRVPAPFLDDTVVDGINKRIESVLNREVLTIRLRELLGAEERHGPSREDLEARLTETGRKIDRLVDALASGADNLPSVRTRLAELERERGSLGAELAQPRNRTKGSTPNDLEATVNALIDALQRFPEALAAG
jgi:site-specific DNA recombinase